MFGPDEEDLLECLEYIEARVVDNTNQTPHLRQPRVCPTADLAPQEFDPGPQDFGSVEAGISFGQCRVLRRYTIS